MPPKKKVQVPVVVPASTPESIAAAQAAQATAAQLADKYKQLQALKQQAASASSNAVSHSNRGALDSSSASAGAAASAVDKAKQLEAIALWKAKQQAQKEAAAIAALTAVGTAVVLPTPTPAAAAAAEPKRSVVIKSEPVDSHAVKLEPKGSRSEPSATVSKKRPAQDMSDSKSDIPVNALIDSEATTGGAAASSASAAGDGAPTETNGDEDASKAAEYVDGSVFVQGFPSHFESDDLIAVFKSMGHVEKVRFGTGRKFAFVVFRAADDAQARRVSEACIKTFDGHDVGDGHKIRCARVRKTETKRTWYDHDASNTADMYDDGRSPLDAHGQMQMLLLQGMAPTSSLTPVQPQAAKRTSIDWGFDDD
jgi:hypothetical protein